MSTDIIKEIDVDVYDRKMIIVKAKQYDKSTRYLIISCYDRGNFIKINKSTQWAYIRLKKPDGRCVFNDCEILNNGKVKIELTEQILAADGNSYVDLVIAYIQDEDVVTNIGEFYIDNGNIFATMPFCIRIMESPCNCWDIESSGEYIALNSLMLQAQKNYYDVMNACKISEHNLISMINRMGGIFEPHGTITFSQLNSVPKAAGYVYHISNEFITDDTFKCGAGKYFRAGATIYCTIDGYWDYFIEEKLNVTDDDNGNVFVDFRLNDYYDLTEY